MGTAGGTAGAIVSGEAGRGGSAGATGGTTAGGGAGGRTGRGGSPWLGRGGAGANSCTNNNDCPDCFRCGPMMACGPIPNASWTVICRRATIAATKPNALWDAMMSGMSALPDVFCELKVDSRSRMTSIDGDSLTPEWNDSVTPLGGELTSSLFMSPENRWSVTISESIRDNATSSAETICSVSPRVTGADLQAGEITFSNVDSCTALVIGFACAD